MPTGTTPPPHGESLDASMEQLQIDSQEIDSQIDSHQTGMWMQQADGTWMQESRQQHTQLMRQHTQLMRQRSLQEMRQIMQEEMGTDTLTTSPFGTPVDDQWMQLEDLDEIDEVTDREITQFIDHITKKIFGHGL